MRKFEITEEIWKRLLALRDGRAASARETAPAEALYGPIASAGEAPFVLAQVGQSLDGRIATPSGDARDVSGPDGLAHLHRCRALVDAVVVGVSTVRADDPQLSVRLVTGPDPVRVVVDCHATLTGEERLFHDGGTPVILFQSTEAPRRADVNAEVIRLSPCPCGLDPHQILDVLQSRGLRRILVEGGARTITRFVHADLVDRLHVVISPIIIGSGPSGIALAPIDRLSSARRPATDVYALGNEVLFDCHLKPAAGLAARDRQKIGMADLA